MMIVSSGRFGAGSSYDSAAQDYFDRVAANGGSLSTTDKDAWNTCIVNLKSASIWTQIVCAGIWGGNDLLSFVVPLVRGPGTATLAEVGSGTAYADSNCSRTTGLTPNANRCFDLGFNADSGSFTADSTTIYEIIGGTAPGSQMATGCNASSKTLNGIFNGTVYASDQYTTTSGSGRLIYTAGSAPTKGHSRCGVRRASGGANSHEIYADGSSVLSDSSTSGSALPTAHVYVVGSNAGGSLEKVWSVPNWCYFFLSALTSSEVSTLDTEVKAAFTAIGRT